MPVMVTVTNLTEDETAAVEARKTEGETVKGYLTERLQEVLDSYVSEDRERAVTNLRGLGEGLMKLPATDRNELLALAQKKFEEHGITIGEGE